MTFALAARGARQFSAGHIFTELAFLVAIRIHVSPQKSAKCFSALRACREGFRDIDQQSSNHRY
jgi:hypothetical protein